MNPFFSMDFSKIDGTVVAYGGLWYQCKRCKRWRLEFK